MIVNNREFIDIWSLIKTTLKEFTLLERFVFIAVYAHDHSLRAISKITKQNTKVIKRILNKIKRRIRKRLKEKGVDPDRVSNVFGSSSIFEITHEDIDDENEEYNNDY